MDQEADLYVKYYEAQAGGSLPILRGSKRYNPQSGAGIGDVFRSVFRTVLPVALQGIGTFIGETLRAKGSGANWKESARTALGPSAKNVLEGVGGAIQSKLSTGSASSPNTQAGSGRKRRRGIVKHEATEPKRRRKRKSKRRQSPYLLEETGMGQQRGGRWLKKGRKSTRRFKPIKSIITLGAKQIPESRSNKTGRLGRYKRGGLSNASQFSDLNSGIKFNF